MHWGGTLKFLGLNLQMAISCHREQDLGSLEEWLVFLTAKMR